jgi:hypothetical protein
MQKISVRYLPRQLTKADKKRQLKELLLSRKLYKTGVGTRKYHTRKSVASFVSKPSKHVTFAKNLYGVDKIGDTAEYARATGCTRKTLAKIIRKGEGAYYSSGSRPNQTAQSWGIARLASATSGGKSAMIDYAILESGCNPRGKAMKLANLAKPKVPLA